MTFYEEAKAPLTRTQSLTSAPEEIYDYPLGSPLLDLTTTDPVHIQQLLANEIAFTISSRIHYLYITNSGLHQNLIEGKDINLQEWQQPPQQYFPSVSALEIYFIPHPSHSTYNISRSTLASLLQAASVSPSFVEVLSNNNGICCSSHSNDDITGEPVTFSLMVKIPLGPFINGAFYLRHDLSSNQTIAVIFFDRKLFKRLEVVLEPRGGQKADPFLPLSLLVSESCKIVEDSRKFLDKEVQLRESSTGATIVAAVPRHKAPIEQYPPLFDKLHTTQQHLLYMEGCIRFQIRLIQFLKTQHEALTVLRAYRLPEDVISIKAHAQKVMNSLDMSLSTMENMLEQVQTLSLRIRIQLGIVSLRHTPKSALY
jgi:hypothetical protein